MGTDNGLIKGTLDLLILKVVSLEPMHGWGIAERIQQLSREVLTVPQGSLYPALHRLEARGWVAAEWRQSDDNRKAKYYQLEPAGRRALKVEEADWTRFMSAVQLVLKSS